jgi:hypothetical protein
LIDILKITGELLKPITNGESLSMWVEVWKYPRSADLKVREEINLVVVCEDEMNTVFSSVMINYMDVIQIMLLFE